MILTHSWKEAELELESLTRGSFDQRPTEFTKAGSW